MASHLEHFIGHIIQPHGFASGKFSKDRADFQGGRWGPPWDPPLRPGVVDGRQSTPSKRI